MRRDRRKWNQETASKIWESWMNRGLAVVVAAAIIMSGVAFQPTAAVHAANETSENKENHWETYDGKSFWYENGVKQGTEADEKALVADGTVRGREICDPSILDEKGNGTWFWLDADPKYDGAKACNKEVWMPYIYQNEKNFDDEGIKRNAAESGSMAAQVEKAIRAAKDGVTDSSVIGKWVRYDADGRMVKGWYTVKGDDAKLYPTQAGNTYYYDFKTGLMAKGKVEIDGKEYRFDETTGALVEGEAPTDEAAGDQTESDTAEGTDAEKKTKTVCVREARYYLVGRASSWLEYEYDGAGNMTKETSYNQDGSIWIWIEYEYDSAGNNTKKTQYNADGSVRYWYEYEYDGAGNMTKETLYKADGSVDCWYEYEYDSDGHNKKKTEYNAYRYNVYGEDSGRDEYEYDSAGNCTKETHYEADDSVIYWYEYEYDGAGNLTKSTVHNAISGVDIWREYEYDDAGNCTKESYYKEDGGVDGWDEYEYDDAGNLTKETTYDVGGSVSTWLEYEYKTITIQ